MAALLSLMIGSSAEDFELYKTDWDFCIKLDVTSDVLLENVRSVVKQLQVRVFCGVTLSFSNMIAKL